MEPDEALERFIGVVPSELPDSIKLRTKKGLLKQPRSPKGIDDDPPRPKGED
jgi:hypothetical protein